MSFLNNKGENSEIAVVKVGGDILMDEQQKTGLAANITSLMNKGWQVILVHGGGSQVSALQKRLGLSARKIEGRRITTPQDLVLVQQAIAGEVNVQLVSLLLSEGIHAFGFHGASGFMIRATKRNPFYISSLNEYIDFGEIGIIQSINTELLLSLLHNQMVPVIATLGVDVNGNTYNINADTTAIKIAESINAQIIFMITAVGGLYSDVEDKSTRLASLNKQTAETLIKEGVIRDGMIPKVREAFSLIDKGVEKVVITSTVNHSAFISSLSNNHQAGTILHR